MKIWILGKQFDLDNDDDIASLASEFEDASEEDIRQIALSFITSVLVLSEKNKALERELQELKNLDIRVAATINGFHL